MTGGWVKLHRSFLKWEWFDEPNTTRVFIWLLLSANHKPTQWRGQTIDRGQLLTGRKQIAAGTGLSEQIVRTALDRLKSTNEITRKTTNKYSIITICNYKHYQRDEREDNQQDNQQATNKQPTTNQQLTISNNDNNYKKDKNIYRQKKSKKEEPLVDRSGNPKRLVKGSQHIWMSEQQIEAFKANYQEDGLEGFYQKKGIDILEGYAINSSKRFKGYKCHYSVLIGWVKGEVMKEKKNALDLERSESYLKKVKG